MAPLVLDHVVIAVADLERARRDFISVGFTVQQGGQHADGVSENVLIGFADGTYLELIAYRKTATDRRWWQLLDRFGPGFVDYALLPEDAAAVVDATRERGLDYAGPDAGGRLRPDGARLSWQTARPPSHDLPFLCGDVTPRELRVREGDVRIHSNRALGIAAISVVVHDLAASVKRFKALTGDAVVFAPQVVPGLAVQTAVVILGETRIELLTPVPAIDTSGRPDPSAPPPDGAAAVLRERLASRGEGPLGIALRVASGGAFGILPLELTHGASIEFVPFG